VHPLDTEVRGNAPFRKKLKVKAISTYSGVFLSLQVEVKKQITGKKSKTKNRNKHNKTTPDYKPKYKNKK
jgi:hypothetical protein